jgi:3-deoxy-D-manno-octulosonic acid kinase
MGKRSCVHHNSMPDLVQKTTKNNILLFDQSLLPEMTAEMFKHDYWYDQHKVIGQAMGRGTTLFFTHNDQQFVLRHYRRGGLIAKLIQDRYFYTGLANSRAWREFHLLNQANTLGLPVPRAAAMWVQRQGLFYRADIILTKIPHAIDVFTLLKQQTLSAPLWRAIGAAIRQLHDAQIYHHDLNIHNLMVDDKHKVWLIDFDKCTQKTGNTWKAANMQRLLRSLNKEKNKQSVFHFRAENWQQCSEGYQGKV